MYYYYEHLSDLIQVTNFSWASFIVPYNKENKPFSISFLEL